MDYLSPVFFGFLLTAVGISLPGLVNMTAVTVTMKQGLRGGLLTFERGQHLRNCRMIGW